MADEQITACADENNITLTAEQGELVKAIVDTLPAICEAAGKLLNDFLDAFVEAAKIVAEAIREFWEYISSCFNGFRLACEMRPDWYDKAQNSRFSFVRDYYARKLWLLAMRV